MPPSNKQKLTASRIAAEMLLHIGRGLMAAQLGKSEAFRDALANGASDDVTPKAFAMPFDAFSGATAKSFSKKLLAPQDWPKIREKVLGLCVRMGYDAEKRARKASPTKKVSAANLKASMKAIQKTDCPSGSPTKKGAGNTCPPEN